MAKDDAHFRLRIPSELKAEIDRAAAENNRSLNAEVVARLQDRSDERKLLEAALSLAERVTESEKSSIAVMRWMRDQMSAQSSIIRHIVEIGGKVDADLLGLLRSLVSTRDQDAGFPLTRDQIEGFDADRLARSEHETVLKKILERRAKEKQPGSDE